MDWTRTVGTKWLVNEFVPLKVTVATDYNDKNNDVDNGDNDVDNDDNDVDNDDRHRIKINFFSISGSGKVEILCSPRNSIFT